MSCAEVNWIPRNESDPAAVLGLRFGFLKHSAAAKNIGERKMKKYLLPLLFVVVSSFSDQKWAYNSTIGRVSVNGGEDSPNAGTTCIVVSGTVSEKCGVTGAGGRMVAIKNNNKQLMATVLAAKSTGAAIDLYYEDAAGSYHCPGHVFTPCAVNSIDLR